MTSKNFPRKIKIDKYEKTIKKQCLFVREPIKKHDLISEMNCYCLANFGVPRAIHPLDEFKNGWIDNIEGQWTSQWFFTYSSYVFWFNSVEDKLLVNLTFLDG